MERQCAAITKKGARCKNEALPAGAWCAHHDPDVDVSAQWAEVRELRERMNRDQDQDQDQDHAGGSPVAVIPLIIPSSFDCEICEKHIGPRTKRTESPWHVENDGVVRSFCGRKCMSVWSQQQLAP